MSNDDFDSHNSYISQKSDSPNKFSKRKTWSNVLDIVSLDRFTSEQSDTLEYCIRFLEKNSKISKVMSTACDKCDRADKYANI